MHRVVTVVGAELVLRPRTRLEASFRPDESVAAGAVLRLVAVVVAAAVTAIACIVAMVCKCNDFFHTAVVVIFSIGGNQRSS
jgi:hypothetical protein